MKFTVLHCILRFKTSLEVATDCYRPASKLQDIPKELEGLLWLGVFLLPGVFAQPSSSTYFFIGIPMAGVLPWLGDGYAPPPGYPASQKEILWLHYYNG